MALTKLCCSFAPMGMSTAASRPNTRVPARPQRVLLLKGLLAGGRLVDIAWGIATFYQLEGIEPNALLARLAELRFF